MWYDLPSKKDNTIVESLVRVIQDICQTIALRSILGIASEEPQKAIIIQHLYCCFIVLYIPR